jgi:hypothetical protein
MLITHNFLQTKRLSSLGLCSVLLLSGCTQQASHISATVKEAFFGFDDIQMSAEQIQAIPYASQYVWVNDGQKILMVLAFADTNPTNGNLQLKWLSSDYAMIVTENGIITKTLKLPTGNVNRSEIPVKPWLNLPSDMNLSWKTRYDWPEQNLYSIQSRSDVSQIDSIQYTSTLWNLPLSHWQEQVYFEQTKQSITNDYWVDANGRVLKSVQYLGPKMTKIEMEAAKPFNTGADQ